jgi:hypothetical protein
MTSSFKSGYIASSDLELSNVRTESKISSTSCPCAQLEFLRDDSLQRILILLRSELTLSAFQLHPDGGSSDPISAGKAIPAPEYRSKAADRNMSNEQGLLYRARSYRSLNLRSGSTIVRL